MRQRRPLAARSLSLAVVLMLVVGLLPGVAPVAPVRAADPIFAFPVGLPGSGGDGSAVAVADFNGDGAQDVVAGYVGARPRLFLNKNDGSGTFLSPTALAGLSAPETADIATGFLNGDALPDIVVANYQQAYEVYLSVAASPGTFAPAVPLADAASLLGIAVAVADIDGQGGDDIILVSNGLISAFYLNNGSGGFGGGLAILSTLQEPLTDVAVADLDGQLGPDLAFSSFLGDSFVLLNDGSGIFTNTEGTIISSGRRSNGIVAGDLNGDGWLDLALANNADTVNDLRVPDPSAIVLNDPGAPGSFGDPLDLPESDFYTFKPELADLNGDGAADVILAVSGLPGAQVYLNRNDGSATFAAPIYVAGSGEFNRSLAVGDLNNDAAPDLLLAAGGAPVQSFLNSLPGSFVAGGFLPPIALTTVTRNTLTGRSGDLNGDGALDLLLVNGRFTNSASSSASLVLINRNDGSGGFLSPVELAGSDGRGSRDGALGDLNGDGRLDIVLVNNLGAGNVPQPSQVYLNDPASPGSFLAPSNLPGALAAARSMALGDLNSDGKLDIVVGYYDRAAQIFRGNGDGSFQGPAPLPGSRFATLSVALGDLNGDARPDLVLNQYANPLAGDAAQISQVYLSVGAPGSFGAPIDVPDSDFFPNTSALGDVTGDGLLDLVMSGFGRPSVVYPNSGDPAAPFLAGQELPGSGFKSLGLSLGDLNGDGALDILLGNYQGQPSQVLINRGNGQFAPPEVLAGSGKDTTRTTLGDFNGDGALDLVLVSSDQLSQLYLNAGAAGIGTPQPLAGSGRNSFTPALGDLDADGDLDILLANFGQASQIFRSGGAGFDLPVDLTTTAVFSSTHTALGDLNNDGLLDIVLANRNRNSVVYLNQPASPGSFGAPADLPGSDRLTHYVATGDLNGDGALDLVLANTGSGGTDRPSQIYVNQNNGSGSFLAPLDLPGSGEADPAAAIGDVNTDGLPDIVLASYNLTPTLYLNPGTADLSGLEPLALPGPPRQSQDVALGDLNGDGALDIIYGNFKQPSQVYLNRNDGSGDFLAPADIPGSGNAVNRIALGDLNGDGALDLVLSSWFNQPSQIYLNRNDGSGAFLAPTEVLGSGGYAVENPILRSAGVLGVALGDLNGDGAPDMLLSSGRGLAALDGLPSLIYWNRRSLAARLPNRPPLVRVGRPGTTPDAALFSAPEILATPTITVPYTLADPDGDPIGAVRFAFSLDGGASWRPAAGTAATDLPTLGTALLLNGRGQGAQSGAIGGLAAGNTPHTIEAWLRPDRLPPSGGRSWPLLLGSPGSGAHQWLLSSAGALSVGAWGGGQLTTTLPVGRWSHIAVSFDGTTARLYRDGELTGSTGATFNLQGVGLSLGLAQLGEAAFAGAIDEVRVWGGARTAAQIAEHARGLPAGTSPGLLALWRFQEQGGRRAVDSVGGLSAALSGGPGYTPTALPHSFGWDVRGSGLFGRSDAVVLRAMVTPSMAPVPDAVAGSYERGLATASSPYLRVRGTQIRVVEAGAPMGGALVYRLPGGQVRGAQLFAPGADAFAFTTDSAGYLQGRGELRAGDILYALAPVDPAGLPEGTRPYSTSFDLYHTNLKPFAPAGESPNGVGGYRVSGDGVQTIVVSDTRPLLLFNLIVSLEWDARYDQRFMAQLQADLRRSSEFLFDASNGQVALGFVDIFHDKELWNYAHVRVLASNRYRPNAILGGAATELFSRTLTTVTGEQRSNTYGPGQLRMGAIWSRFGNQAGSSLSEDWPRTLAHELSHFLLFQDDNYVGLNSGGALIPVDSCPGIMSDPYASLEFRTADDWLPGCADTLSNRTMGRADWATIESFYPMLRGPGGAFGDGSATLGPAILPLEVTDIFAYEPLTPTARLDVPVFYTVGADEARYLAGPRATGFLIQDSWVDADTLPDRITNLGRVSLDQVLARGARVGDEVCLLDPLSQAVGCEVVRAGDERLTVRVDPQWRPDIAVTPVTSRTLAIEVRTLDAQGDPVGLGIASLTAQLFPPEDLPVAAPITLLPGGAPGVYTGQFELDDATPEAYVLVTATSQRRALTSFAIGGSPIGVRGGGIGVRGGGIGVRGGGIGVRGGGIGVRGGGIGVRGGGIGVRGGGIGVRGGGIGVRGGGIGVRGGGAPVASAEGDVLIFADDVSFSPGQHFILQQATALPPPPAWASVIGSGYRFTVSPDAPNLSGAQLSFNYLGSEVPAGEEGGIRVYYRAPGPGSSWVDLPTSLNPYHNQAATDYAGPGLYALMSSVELPLRGPGWNLISYPVAGSRAVGAALAAIDGFYSAVYGWDPADTSGNPWRRYLPELPAWVNTLADLEYGKGYWISADEDITLLLRGGAGGGGLAGEHADMSMSLPAPPATIYGSIGAGLGIAPGRDVGIWAGGTRCGGGRTLAAEGGVVYAADALSDMAQPGCGASGRTLTITIDGRRLGGFAWDGAVAQRVDLGAGGRLYLPVVGR